MANEEYLKILRQGFKVWNRWRGEHRDVRLDFSGADLSGADLSWANLSGANLRRANLERADLRGANLSDVSISEANLSRVNLKGANLERAILIEMGLSEANLERADLIGVVLERVDLEGANLEGANLKRTSFSEAYLKGANLSRVALAQTMFAAVDLSTVIGLESVQHNQPSTIGIDTLYLSQGKIPESFLRGCGVPEILIENLPLLLGAAQVDVPTPEIFTLSSEEIAQQRALLAAHRRTLANDLHRLALNGLAHAPPAIVNGIAYAREQIARIKTTLRTCGVQVPNHPDDTDD